MVLPGSSEPQFNEERRTLLRLYGLVAVLMFGGWLWLVAWLRTKNPRQQSVGSSEANARSEFIAEAAPATVRR